MELQQALLEAGSLILVALWLLGTLKVYTVVSQISVKNSELSSWMKCTMSLPQRSLK